MKLKPLRYLNSIICTVPAPSYGEGMRQEVTYSYIRPYRLTERGAQRMVRAEHGSEVSVCRIEVATYAR